MSKIIEQYYISGIKISRLEMQVGVQGSYDELTWQGHVKRFREPEAVARDLMRQHKLTKQVLHEIKGLLCMRHDASSCSEATG